MNFKYQSYLLYLWILLMPFFGLSAETTDIPQDTPTELEEPRVRRVADEGRFYSDFINMLTTLGMLVALLLLATWFLKKMTRTRQLQLNTSSLIKILEQRQLSPRSTLHLIEVGGKTLLIGESPTAIAQLSEL
jgi:flagellar biosynthetic protein FliO